MSFVAIMKVIIAMAQCGSHNCHGHLYCGGSHGHGHCHDYRGRDDCHGQHGHAATIIVTIIAMANMMLTIVLGHRCHDEHARPVATMMVATIMDHTGSGLDGSSIAVHRRTREVAHGRSIFLTSRMSLMPCTQSEEQ